MKDSYKILEDIVRESYVGVVWSHKIQEKQSDIYAELTLVLLLSLQLEL